MVQKKKSHKRTEKKKRGQKQTKRGCELCLWTVLKSFLCGNSLTVIVNYISQTLNHFFSSCYILRNYEHSSNHNFSWFYSILLIFGVRNLCMFLHAMNYNHLCWCNLCCLRVQNWILNSVYFECQCAYCNNFVPISLIRMPLVHRIKKNM